VPDDYSWTGIRKAVNIETGCTVQVVVSLKLSLFTDGCAANVFSTAGGVETHTMLANLPLH